MVEINIFDWFSDNFTFFGYQCGFFTWHWCSRPSPHWKYYCLMVQTSLDQLFLTILSLNFICLYVLIPLGQKTKTNSADTKWRLFAISLHLLSPAALLVLNCSVESRFFSNNAARLKQLSSESKDISALCFIHSLRFLTWVSQQVWTCTSSQITQAHTHVCTYTKSTHKKEVPVSFACFLHMNPAGDQSESIWTHSVKFMWI